MKIGIGVNHYHPSIGGAEKVAQVIAEYLSEFHEVYVFTRKNKGRDKRDFKNYRVIEYRPGDLVPFLKRIKDIKLDVFMIYSDVFDFFRPLAIQKNPFQLVLALCGANWLHTQRNYIKSLYRNADNIKSIILHSKCERDYRICDNDRLLPKTVIIPNGVHLEEFEHNTLKRSDLAPDIADKRWILNVSNFFPGKGQEHMFDILSGLPSLEDVAYIQICGDIEFKIGELLEVKWKIGASKLKKQGATIRLKKNLSRDQVVGFFKESNVFAFTSEKEVAPLVLLEAMASSLPWVSTNVGNAADLKGGMCIKSIKNSGFHSVFDVRIKDAFVREIQNMWNKPKIGEFGRRQIEQDMVWDKILPQYRSVLEG